ncbi:FecR family protein [Sphingobacterium ginsenosidimutans]|uniref:FecR domain-containing protein n=1 Tax=Sphingobacterium ginsenosidimutans TaxID=687845 RepID=A0ABP8AB61_9SPHI
MNQDQFLDLLNRQLEGTLNPEEKRLLEKLINEDSRNKVLYNFIVSKVQSSQSSIPNTESAFDQIWQQIESTESEINTVKSEEVATPSLRLSLFETLKLKVKQVGYPFYLAAASVLVILSTGIWWYKHQARSIEYGMHYSSAKGEKRILNLPDGSTVWLNGDSKLYLAKGFNKKDRHVKLIGEGFFSVAKDKRHPFIVSYKDAEVKVLGTKFNIRAYPDEHKIQTSLVEGAIEMTDRTNGETYRMIPGEKITIAEKLVQQALRKTRIPLVQRTELQIQEGEKMPSETLWLENKLSFEGDPMSIVASKISKWYNRNIIINNTELENTTFTGTMEGYNLDMALKTITLANPAIRVKHENDTIILY